MYSPSLFLVFLPVLGSSNSTDSEKSSCSRDFVISYGMMACGDHLKELAYATRKIGIQWAGLSES